MQIFNQKEALTQFLQKEKKEHKTIGLVPTMGALHKGHLSLVHNALNQNDIVVVSIFVNPTQFDNKTDLEKYPKTMEKDLKILEDLSHNLVVFTPNAHEIYDNNIASEKFDFDGLEHEMEGKFRTGHFDGVGTIVKKLFSIVMPDNAYFGEKDFQQLQIIKKMVQKHRIPVNVIGCPISREANGLAMSSRNERLSAELREEASFIYKTITAAKNKFGTESAEDTVKWIEGMFSNNPSLSLEYAEIADENTLKPVKTKEENKHYRLFVAVYANDIRLIDNVALN
ncbi:MULTISPECIES: pantoate--beta-alanine ligase [Galbibacter]|uniref:Pantothenate synthetase n=1 Tax=Galbibacter pacificus TaxID=2996052 RepID=A0ABT6FSJ1_9FLAO|nr:pantoate--beta-alanine ligase [Galbibacter pacificus]MDG3582639.1 pantoate--beta-alanine ligase [Galbibacter pacificus]MDG3586242.1 pantoate--beta-alanine ligase [Galbibacter pacificus]